MREPDFLPGRSSDFPVVTVAQFFLAFALNFMFVFLPFYIHHISPHDQASTLRWTGLIVGASPAFAVFGSTFWGRLTDRYSPKGLFERGMLSHAVLVASMAFVTDLRLLLLIRIVQGFMGGISTIGLIIVAAVSPEEKLPRRMGMYQSALTLGQIFAPPLGALAAAAWGFRGAFLASGLMLFAVFLYTRIGLTRLPPRPHQMKAAGLPRRQLWLAWALSFAGTLHIMFLPSVLPTILQNFGVPDAHRLATAGTIVFAYGLSAAAGGYGFSRLAGRVPIDRLILLTAGGAACCQIALLLGTESVTFTLIRVLQTAFAAGIFPLLLARVAAQSETKAIGFVNTARFAGNALGPITATFILAHADLLTLYLTLGIGLAILAAAHQLAAGQPA